MYKNYWLRRKAIREDALIVYNLGRSCEDALIEYPDHEKKWKRMEMFSQNHSWIMKDDGLPCGDWAI